MRAEVGLEGTNAVQNAERGHHPTERAKDDQPGREATFWISIVILDKCFISGRNFVNVTIEVRFVCGCYGGAIGSLSIGCLVLW